MWAVFIILFIIVAVFAIRQSMKRTAAWKAFCSRYGFRFFGGASFFSVGSASPPTWASFRLFSKGHSRRVGCRGQGEYRGFTIELFDYQYTTGSGKSQDTHYYTPLLIRTTWPLGRIIIRPESFLDKIAGAFGFDDIDLDYHEFNRKFYVKSPDKKFAYDLLHHRAMEYLLAIPGITVEIAGRSFLFYYEGKLSPERFPALLDAGVDFIELLPGFIRKREDVR